LACNLAASQPLLLVVDDAHWADEPSLRWLAYLVSRLEGLSISVLVALRPGELASTSASLASLRIEATAVVSPALLSESAVREVVRATVGDQAGDEFCKAVWTASGGNPLYVTELLRAVRNDKRSPAAVGPAVPRVGGREGIARRVVASVRGLGPSGL